MKQDHGNVMAIMGKRQSDLSLVLKYWGEGDVMSALNALANIKDTFTALDVFKTTFAEGKKLEILTLDHMPLLVALVLNLIRSKYEMHIKTGLATMQQLFKVFGDACSCVHG
jgi:hypothetical protein